jgi:hypothetical protein
MNDPWPLTGRPDPMPLIEPRQFDPLELLTVDDVAALWHRSRKVVLRLVRAGRLRPVGFDPREALRIGKQGRKDFRFTRESVEQAVRELTATWMYVPPAEGGPKPLPRRPLPVNLKKLWDGKSRL